MFRFLSAVGLHDKVEAGRLHTFITELLKDPELSRSAYVRAGEGSMFIEKRRNMGPFFVTLSEKSTGGTHELVEVYPGVRETWGRKLSEVNIAEDRQGHFFASGIDCVCGEPITLILSSAANLFNDEGRVHLPETPLFSCYALAQEGKILLGSSVNEEARKAQQEDEAWRREVSERARRGDPSAINEIQNYMKEVESEVLSRFEKEDVYSVLDGLFTPLGAGSRYALLGEIFYVDKMMNPLSGEWVYRLEIRTAASSIGVYIHPNDLLGEPKKGYRFSGEAVLVGMYDPESLLDDTDRGFY